MIKVYLYIAKRWLGTPVQSIGTGNATGDLVTEIYQTDLTSTLHREEKENNITSEPILAYSEKLDSQ